MGNFLSQKECIKKKLKIQPDTQRGELELTHCSGKRVLDKPQNNVSAKPLLLILVLVTICKRNNAHVASIGSPAE